MKGAERLTDKAQATQDGRSGTEEENSLSVTDNRTGKTYDVEIKDGTVRAMDLRQIKVSDDDFGLMTYDPGFSNTASCRSAITYIDGENGVLEHRGIPIEQLAENSSFLEVSYLLIYGHLPTEDQLNDWIYQITHHTYVHENIKDFMSGFRHDANPMGMLLASVGALSTFYPEAVEVGDDYQRHVSAVRMIAKMPTLAAFAYRRSLGLPYVYPDNDLSYTGNFLSMLFKMAEPPTSPTRVSRRPSTCSSSSTPTTSRTARRRPYGSQVPLCPIHSRLSLRVWPGSTDRCTEGRTWRC
jgi:citrate synthase